MRTANGGGEGARRSPRAAPERGLGAEEAAAAAAQGQRRAAGIGHARRPRSLWEARSDGQLAGAAPDGVQRITVGERGPRDPEEAAAAASAAPAASLPTLRPRTLEEPPPPPAAASGPLVRARTGALLPLSLPPGSRCACSLSRDPPPSDSRRGPKALPLLLPARGAREAGGSESPPAVGWREARPTLLAPPPGLTADWLLQGNHLHILPAPISRARALGELEPPTWSSSGLADCQPAPNP